jgi:hypothetical protein
MVTNKIIVYFILSLIILCFVSCDPIVTGKIQGKQEYQNEYFIMSFRSMLNTGAIKFIFVQKVELNIDSLILVKADGSKIDVKFYPDEKIYEVKSQDTIQVMFRFNVNDAPFYLLPCSFIAYDRKLLITDTIRIEIKNNYE